jgi:hypothetical protein
MISHSRLSVGAALPTLMFTSLFLCPAESKPDTTQLIARLSGSWKEDATKRKLGSMQKLRFRTTASGGVEELRGPETRPLVQPVSFDGKPHEIDSGISIAWKQIDAENYERLLWENGQLLSTRRIKISTDGKTLSEESERKRPDGTTVTGKMTFRRLSPEPKGLVGIWKAESIKNDSPVVLKYEPSGKDSVKVTGNLGQTYTLTFDGKPAAVLGPGMIPNMTIAAKPINDHTLETTSSREGVAVGKAMIVLSDGGKVMTVTSTQLGANNSGEPSVAVYEKQ